MSIVWQPVLINGTARYRSFKHLSSRPQSDSMGPWWAQPLVSHMRGFMGTQHGMVMDGFWGYLPGNLPFNFIIFPAWPSGSFSSSNAELAWQSSARDQDGKKQIVGNSRQKSGGDLWAISSRIGYVALEMNSHQDRRSCRLRSWRCYLAKTCLYLQVIVTHCRSSHCIWELLRRIQKIDEHVALV